MTKRLDRIVDDAVAQGLIERAVADEDASAPPWPVVITTAFMSMLASIPVCGMLFLLFSRESASEALLPGLVVVACAAAILRAQGLPLFMEYLCVSILGSGLVLVLADGFSPGSLALAGLLALGLTVVVPQPWVRALLAAASVGQLIVAFAMTGREGHRAVELAGCHIALLAWLGAHPILRAAEREGKYAVAAWFEAVLLGAGILIIVSLAYVAGSTFLVSGLVPGRLFGRMGADGVPWISAAAAAIAVAWLSIRPEAKPYRRWLLATAPVVVVLAWFSVSLGALMVMIVACLCWQRPNVAMLAGTAALWTVGALYYALDWSLVHKALMMLGAGAVLLASTLLIGVAEPAPAAVGDREVTRQWTGWATVVPALLVLAITNVGIWQKEQVVRHGVTVFVELAPVDPRSLMQGDYMTLAFALPPAAGRQANGTRFVVAQRGENGIAVLSRYHGGVSELAPGELLIEVTRRGTRDVLVTDAWFFKEGEAGRWSGARYGEFRVAPDGKAVLVGLRGAKLKAL